MRRIAFETSEMTISSLQISCKDLSLVDADGTIRCTKCQGRVVASKNIVDGCNVKSGSKNKTKIKFGCSHDNAKSIVAPESLNKDREGITFVKRKRTRSGIERRSTLTFETSSTGVICTVPPGKPTPAGKSSTRFATVRR